MEKKVQARSIKSREKIKKAALQLFSHKGYYNTNTKEIAKAAGISVGSFYNYYKDKGEIYCALSTDYIVESVKSVKTLMEAMARAADYRKVFVTYMDNQMERGFAMGHFFSDCALVMADQHNGLDRIFVEKTEEAMGYIEGFIQSGQGLCHRGSPRVMARMVYTIINNVTEDIFALEDKALQREYTDGLIALVLEYLDGHPWTRE